MDPRSAGGDPLLTLLFDDASAARCLVGPDRSVLRMNREWLRATASEVEAAGLDPGELPAAAGEAALALCREARAEGHVAVPRHPRRIEGRETFWEGGIDPVPMAGGTGWLLTLREARPPSTPTDATSLESTLRDTRAKLAAALASMTDAVFISDAQGNFVEFNDAFATVHRFGSKAECARTFAEYPDILDLFLPDGTLAPTEQWAVPRALRGETATNAEYTLRRKDTGETWIGSYSFAPIRQDGRIVGSVVVGRDVTAVKAAEAAVREREERLAVTLRSIGDAVIATDERGRVTLLNPEASRLVGWPSEEAVGLPVGEVFRIVAEDDLAPVECPVDRVLREGVVVGLAKHTCLVARDGSTRPVADSGAPIRDGQGRITGAVLVFRDQTAERAAERALRERELRLRAMVDQAAVGVVEVETATGRFLRVNSRFCEMVGYARDEVMALTWRDLTHPDDLGKNDAGVRRMLETGEPYRTEKRFRRKDGSIVWGRVNVNRIALPGEPPSSQVAVVEDVTEHRALEERFRQAQKLDSVGRLAGGVAHDFNNLLTVILSSAASLEDALPGDLSDRIEEVREVREAARRASELTRQLLAFARKQLIAPIPLDLGEVVQGSEKMLRRLLGEDVEVQVRLEPDLWTVHADPGQLEQVIVNLAVNARDAMPRGGTLVLETQNGRTTPDYALEHPGRLVGDWVRLLVRDSGVGMSAEVKGHLFEPFFTTKAPGKGTGLGLATVYGIVQQAGGHVHVDSEPGRGATFEICFPRFPGQPLRRGSAVVPAVTSGSERILVVEDDAQVRGVVTRALHGAGYDVFTAADPREALELGGEELRRVKLLLTDVVMPGLDGHELATRIRRRFPALRVLYLTGYTQDTIADHGVLGPGIQLLQKPFTGAQLLARVRAVLDAGDSAALDAGAR